MYVKTTTIEELINRPYIGLTAADAEGTYEWFSHAKRDRLLLPFTFANFDQDNNEYFFDVNGIHVYMKAAECEKTLNRKHIKKLAGNTKIDCCVLSVDEERNLVELSADFLLEYDFMEEDLAIDRALADGIEPVLMATVMNYYDTSGSKSKTRNNIATLQLDRSEQSLAMMYRHKFNPDTRVPYEFAVKKFTRIPVMIYGKDKMYLKSRKTERKSNFYYLCSHYDLVADEIWDKLASRYKIGDKFVITASYFDKKKNISYCTVDSIRDIEATYVIPEKLKNSSIKKGTKINAELVEFVPSERIFKLEMTSMYEIRKMSAMERAKRAERHAQRMNESIN